MGKGLSKEEISRYYDIKEKLGTGSFAVVKKCVHKKTGAEFAVKIVKKKNLNQEELATITEEVEIMQTIKHPNIVQLETKYETSKHLYMVLELLTGGELFERIVAKEHYTEREASQVIASIVKAIQYLHGEGIVHRDLKPENLIYKDKSDKAMIKITDFGLAKKIGPTDAMTTACGTPGYVAPEILKNEPYDKAVDLWSVGVILYILLCGFPPFYDESAAGLYSQIKRGEFDFPDPYWEEISPEAKDLVTKLLTVDPRKRCTAEGLLAHPWIKSASDRDMGSAFQGRLRKFNAKRKLRRGVNTVIAVNRLVRGLKLQDPDLFKNLKAVHPDHKRS